MFKKIRDLIPIRLTMEQRRELDRIRQETYYDEMRKVIAEISRLRANEYLYAFSENLNYKSEY